MTRARHVSALAAGFLFSFFALTAVLILATGRLRAAIALITVTPAGVPLTGTGVQLNTPTEAGFG